MVPKLYRAWGVVLLIVATMLAGCVAATPTQEAPAAATATPEAPPPPNMPWLEILGETDDSITVKHFMGETAIPKNPQRVVVSGSGYHEAMLALGLTPAGMSDIGGEPGEPMPAYLGNQLDGVALIGTIFEPSLEAVLEVNPDLIIGMSGPHDAIYENLSAIAPTILIENPWMDWRETLRIFGIIFGMEDVANERLAGYEQKVADARAALDEAVGDAPVAYMRILANEVRIYGTSNPLYADLGVAPSSLTPTDAGQRPLSIETLPDLDAEYIFMVVQSDEKLQEMQNSGLWANVPAVQNDKVFSVDLKSWIQGTGLLAYESVVDDVLAALVSGE